VNYGPGNGANTGNQVWDSGKVDSSAESYVSYSGPSLADGTSYTWTVRTWDSAGVASPYATPATFDTGINDNEWDSAQWIRRQTTSTNDETLDYSLYRKDFTLNDPSSQVVRARVYVAASAGLWQLHVNGQALGTQYDYQAAGETYYDVKNITAAAQAAESNTTDPNQMAIGVKYANWGTTEGESHQEGPVQAATTLKAATTVGQTTITVAADTYYSVGEVLGFDTTSGPSFETDTIQSISGTTITLATGLQYAHASGAAVIAEDGPSGLLAKVVVDYADGTSQTIVTDPSWLVTRDPEELDATATDRTSQDGDNYVEYDDGATAISDWDALSYTPTTAEGWSPAISMGTEPLAQPASCANYLSGGSPCGLGTLYPQQSSMTYKIIHPVSVTTLSDGTMVADFGTAIDGVPAVQVNDGVSGNQLDLDGSYRLDHGTLASAASPGDTSVSVTIPASTSGGFIVEPGDTVTLGAPADGYGGGNPGDGYESNTVPETDGGSLAGGESDPVTSVSIPDTLSIGGTATGGTFTLTDPAWGTTAAIPYNATAAQVASALNALTGASGVTATGGPLPTTPVVITDNPTAIGNHQLTDTSSLTGTKPTVTLALGLATIGLQNPVVNAQAVGAWVQGSRVGSPSAEDLDNQGTNLNFYYTEASGSQTSNFFVTEGYRYLEISNPDALADPGSSPVDASQIWAIAEAENAPVSSNVYSVAGFDNNDEASAQNEATFTSSNNMLNDVFDMDQRSALYAGQEEFNDSPDRQDGQFLGDAENESQATMESLDERTLSREAILDNIYGQARYWLDGSLSDDGAQNVIVPGPAGNTGAGGDEFGAMQAVYPDGDGMRDIPDYTEMFPEWVWDYYVQTGDAQTLEAAYQAMQYVGDYVTDAIPVSGPFAGLVYNLPGGDTAGGTYPNNTASPSSSYGHGILDWPAPMRYRMTQNLASLSGGASQAEIDDRAVGVYSALADAANALGDTSQAAGYTTQMTNLVSTINSTMVDTSSTCSAATGLATCTPGLYDDAVEATSSTAAATKLAANTEEHAQAFAVAYGVAPTSSYGTIGNAISSDGMESGPMDLGQLEQSLVDTGQDTGLVSLLTNANADGPAKILAEGGTLTWEQWNPGCDPASGQLECTSGSQINQGSSGSDDIESFSHGWGSVGTVGILRGLLGLTVTGPGASTIQIEPPNGGLTSASGTEYTERGQVGINWSVNNSGQYTLKASIPDNVAATVYIPDPNCAIAYTATADSGAVAKGCADTASSTGTDNGTQQIGDVAKFTVGSAGSVTFFASPLSTTASLSPSAVNGYYNVDPTVTLNADDTGGPGVAATMYQIDNGGWQTYQGSFQITGDGDHTLQYYSTDDNGSVENTNTMTVDVDTTPPVSSIQFSPIPVNGATQGAATATISATDNVSGVATTMYQIDGGGWQTYSGQFQITDPGNHTIQYYSTDEAGNVESTKSASIATYTAVTPGNTVTGTVPSTLGVSVVGSSTPSLGAFVPGSAQTYSTTLDTSVTSSAGNAALTAVDASAPPTTSSTGYLVNDAAGGPYTLRSPLQVDATDGGSNPSTGYQVLTSGNPVSLLSYSAPVSDDPVVVGFQQSIGATDPLRTGTYGISVTLTLSTTSP
jgi:hypothetical protein